MDKIVAVNGAFGNLGAAVGYAFVAGGRHSLSSIGQARRLRLRRRRSPDRCCWGASTSPTSRRRRLP